MSDHHSGSDRGSGLRISTDHSHAAGARQTDVHSALERPCGEQQVFEGRTRLSKRTRSLPMPGREIPDTHSGDHREPQAVCQFVIRVPSLCAGFHLPGSDTRFIPSAICFAQSRPGFVRGSPGPHARPHLPDQAIRADVEDGRPVCRSKTKSRTVPGSLSRPLKSPDSSLLERHRSKSEAVGRCTVVLADHAIPRNVLNDVTPTTTLAKKPTYSTGPFDLRRTPKRLFSSVVAPYASPR